MTPRTKKTAVALSGALVLASGAYALGTQAGGGAALAGGTNSPSVRIASPHGPGPRDLSGIADRLGVTEAKLRAAIEDLRPDLRAKKDEHQDALAKALASELGLDAAKVTAALDKFHGERKVFRRERRGDRVNGFDDALAAKLGVDAAKIRSAFESLKPGPDRRAGKPALADLAKKIGVSEDKLRSALDDLRPHRRLRGPGFGHGDVRVVGPAPVAGLAKELGVTRAKLRAALEKVRGDLAQQHEAERDAFIAKLADRLGVSEAKIKDVIGSRPHHGRRGP
jgi:biotin operon repressor